MKILALLLTLSTPALANPKLSGCQACHGKNGISSMGAYPNLAGQKKQYLMDQLKAFKTGTRKNPLMSPMAAGLTETDIEQLAEYFSKQTCK